MRFTILAAALSAATFAPSASDAAIDVTYARVAHNTDVVLDSMNPGNSFSTVGQHVGVALNFGPAGGTLHIEAKGFVPYPFPTPDGGSTTGTIDFTVSNGTLSLTPAIGLQTNVGGQARGQMLIKNLGTNQTYLREFISPGVALARGDLPTLAPAGNYEITWNISGNHLAGTDLEGTMNTSFAFVPEPAALGAFALAALPILRRR